MNESEPQRVLEWINEIRTKRNIGPPLDALPKGVRYSSNQCPVARGLSASLMGVTRVYWELDPASNNDEYVPFNPVGRFAKEFDCGFYPELVE
jgi:hypothetical protein